MRIGGLPENDVVDEPGGADADCHRDERGRGGNGDRRKPFRLDDGNMWPSAFAVTRLAPADEARIAALVKKAVG